MALFRCGGSKSLSNVIGVGGGICCNYTSNTTAIGNSVGFPLYNNEYFSVNGAKLTCLKACNVRFTIAYANAGTTGYNGAWVRVNGTTILSGSGVSGTWRTYSAEVSLNVGDEITFNFSSRGDTNAGGGSVVIELI